MNETITGTEVHATIAGIPIFWSDLASSAGCLTDEGYRFLMVDDLAVWTSKSAVTQAARAIDWPTSTAAFGHSRFYSRFWVLHCPGGGFLTNAGYRRIKNLTHLTETWERSNPGLAASGFSKRTRRSRDQKLSGWVCTCRAGGITADRSAAVRAGAEHRNAQLAIAGRVVSRSTGAGQELVPARRPPAPA